VSLTNLSLSCYPDRLEYVDQVLKFAHEKIQGFTTRSVFAATTIYKFLTSNSPDLHTPQTTANLAALLLAPINSYQSVLTLLALQQYSPLLSLQPFSTRRSLAHAVISSVLKNETIIETPEDVNGILELCHVLIKDQSDGAPNSQSSARERRGGSHVHEKEELAEEQGWIARMVHLFRAESLDVQFEVRRVLWIVRYRRLTPSCSYYKQHGDISRLAVIACVSLTLLLSRPPSSYAEGVRTGNTLYARSPRHRNIR
jgi:vacuolar protein sorting-associated protein 35